jgi:hypothetical protein
MAPRRASLSSLFALRESASPARFPPLLDSGSLHAGQRLAKPGLSGFSSNSSEQTTQVLMGKDIPLYSDY